MTILKPPPIPSDCVCIARCDVSYELKEDAEKRVESIMTEPPRPYKRDGSTWRRGKYRAIVEYDEVSRTAMIWTYRKA